MWECQPKSRWANIGPMDVPTLGQCWPNVIMLSGQLDPTKNSLQNLQISTLDSTKFQSCVPAGDSVYVRLGGMRNAKTWSKFI